MRFQPLRSALALCLGVSILSCKETTPTAPQSSPAAQLSIANSEAPSITSAAPEVVISQVYGGGGNSGATYKNDFIELFNPGSQPVTLDGWSVQYASAAGTSWQVTKLSGTMPPGAYYLVQESAGAGGTTALPAPDATGSIAMSATAGKVWLARTATALSGACPAGASVVDQVSFGTNASDCGFKTTATLANTTAAVRKDKGCAYTGDLSADFVVGAPTPRNSASAKEPCQAVPVGALDHVVMAGAATITVGTTSQFTAAAKDANGYTIASATITWSSSNETIATVDATGSVTGVAASETPVTITATAVDGDITKSASMQVTVAEVAINWVDISSSSSSFPPGFQTQLFATARVSQGGEIIPATFTFEALDPQIATIATVQNTGIVTGVAAPTDGTTRPGFRVTATPLNGGKPYSFVTHAITIESPTSAPTSIYGANDEFGTPTAASTSNPNDFLIRRPQYTLSYNQSRGTPNWVSYELDARQMASGQDRCNCFTADPLLPTDKQILTSDYTNGGYDRGHMTRSADRTVANVDNATTFYLTNIVPQMADLNQGVWAQFENALADSARVGGRAVYIITGPLYSRSHGLTFLKNEGKVAIPDSTWKVAFIGPRNGGNPFTRGDVQTWDDLAGLTVLAVNMPNVAGVRNDPWSKYLTTVDRIEAATAYDFLSLLPIAFQTALEAGDRAPVARFSTSGARDEGAQLSFDASASTDPDLGRADMGRAESLTYAWQFSDGTTASGKFATKTFARSGAYTATLVVTDAFGWPSTTTQSLTIANVAPSIAPLASASLIAGESYAATGTFTDPGTGNWTATVDYGDGSGARPLALDDKSFSLAHTYSAAGTFTVRVSVADDAGGRGTATATVSVQTAVAATQAVSHDVQALASAGEVRAQDAGPLLSTLDAAASQLERGNSSAAFNQLGATLNQVSAAERAGRMSPEVAQKLSAPVWRIRSVLQ